MEADAFNDRIRDVLTRFVRDIFVIAAVTASLFAGSALLWIGIY
jgi:hypothetical protein